MSEQSQKAANGNGNGNGQSAIVRGPQARMAAVKAELSKAGPALAALLPKHVTIDRMMRIITSTVSRTPDLQECTPQSIVLAAAQACSLGLEPGTPLGLAYLIPFNNKKTQRKEAQFLPSYRGLTRLAIQSGEVQSIQARIVYARDTFEIDYGTEQSIVHRPYLAGEPGEVVGAYAVAEMKNGSKVFEFMTVVQLEKIRKASKAGDDGPWRDHTEEMYKKTAVRRVCKSLPLSEEKLARALEHQAQAEGGKGPDFADVIDVLPEETDPVTGEVKDAPTRTEAMKDRLADKAASS